MSKIGTALACWYLCQLNQFNGNAPILLQSGKGLTIKKDSIGSGLVIVGRKKWGTLPREGMLKFKFVVKKTREEMLKF